MSTQEHYNHVAKHPPTQCIHMRKAHNRAKQLIIQRALHYMALPMQSCSVLDLACGRGGDLCKVRYCRAYYGIDIAEAALEELQRRARELGMHHVSVEHGDAATCTATVQVDMVLCNFALHYFCDSAQHVSALLQTISASLVAGGMLCGTFELSGATAFGVQHVAIVGDCVHAVEWRIPWERVVRLAHKYGLALMYQAELRHLHHDADNNICGFIMQKAQEL